jgi:flagellar biosynthetic protein FliR
MPITFALDSFLLIFARLSGLFISAPIFSSRQMPLRIKALVIVLLSAVMAYFVPVNYMIEPATVPYYIAALLVEVFVGYTMGFVVYVVLAAIQLAGQVMDMAMGFAIVNVVDPQTGTQIPLMGNLTQTMALLMYLAMDGHYYLLQAIAQSYKIVPVLGVKLSQDFFNLLFEITVYMFIIAVKIAAPILVTVLITDIAMGFIARTVPQMNVFIVGLPLKILVGLFALLLLLPVYLWVYSVLFMRFFAYLDRILIAMGL